ncbi:MAG: aspartate aminotransferase family protein [Bacteroidetes bacterium]|nr:aspartate aminotransferase family protein [Bacteroidota bacterium]
MAHTESSKEKRSAQERIFIEACKVLPGGVSRNTVFHKPHPYYVAHASGCRVTDIDGVERIDFANNMASLIHGHAHPAIVEAVTAQLRKGTAYTMATEAEVSYAQLLTGRVRSVEMLRFTNSGTEAVMGMIKAARAFTGRSKIAKAEGAYHGTYDFAEVSQTSGPGNWGEIDSPNSVPLAKGTPEGVLRDVIVFPFNDTDRTLAILDRHAGQIACVLIDPVPHRVGLVPAKSEYIEALFDWTRRNGALLAFDEVVTFRVNYGGAQENYNVLPDLTAFGKIIGGGFPVGAFGGRRDVMQVLDPRVSPLPFPYSGTFSANPITTTAGRVAMELFDREAVEKLNRLTIKAIDQIDNAIKIAGIPASVTGAGSMFRLHLTPTPPATYREAYQTKEVSSIIDDLLDHMYSEGKVLMINTCACMLSTAITSREVDMLSEALLNSFRHIKPKLMSTIKQTL